MLALQTGGTLSHSCVPLGKGEDEKQSAAALRRWVSVQQAADADGSWHWELGADRETPSLNGRRFIGRENFDSL